MDKLCCFILPYNMKSNKDICTYPCKCLNMFPYFSNITSCCEGLAPCRSPFLDKIAAWACKMNIKLSQVLHHNSNAIHYYLCMLGKSCLASWGMWASKGKERIEAGRKISCWMWRRKGDASLGQVTHTHCSKEWGIWCAHIGKGGNGGHSLWWTSRSDE